MPQHPTSPSFEVAVAESRQQRKEVYGLRYQIYAEEMGKRPGSAEGEAKLWRDDLDDWALHLCVRADGRLAAAMRLNLGGDGQLPEHYTDIYSLDRFAAFPIRALSFSSALIVAPDWRGSRVLSYLLSGAYMIARKRNVRFNFCHCAPALVQYFEQLGYRRYTANFVDDDFGFRVPVAMLLEDLDHLEAVHSPLARLAERWKNRPDTSEWFSLAFPASVGFINERLMSIEDFWSFLASRIHDESVPLLRGLTEDEAKRFFTAGMVLRCTAGDKVVRKGDTGNEMFVILSGAAEVRARVGGRDQSLAVLGRGEVFGEMALLGEMPRTADVVALRDLEVLVLTQPFLRECMQTMPSIAMKVLFNISLTLCERLRKTTHNWVAALHSDFDAGQDDVVGADKLA